MLAAAFILLTVLISFPHPVHAASYHLSISPPVLEITMKPQKSFIQTFTLKNQGSSLTLVPKIIKVKPLDNQGHITITNLQSATNLPLQFSLENSQIKLSQPFTLPANQTAQLVLRLASATVDQPQDFYLALALIPQQSSTNQNPLSQPIITSLLLITVTPDQHLPLKLQLKNFQLPHLHDSSTPLKINFQLQNQTPIKIWPKILLSISDWHHRQLKPPQPPSNLLLGNTSRSFQTVWQPPKLAFGPYQIDLIIQSQHGTTLIQQTQTVFILPFKIALYSTIIILLGTLLLSTKLMNNKGKQNA